MGRVYDICSLIPDYCSNLERSGGILEPNKDKSTITSMNYVLLVPQTSNSLPQEEKERVQSVILLLELARMQNHNSAPDTLYFFNRNPHLVVSGHPSRSFKLSHTARSRTFHSAAQSRDCTTEPAVPCSSCQTCQKCPFWLVPRPPRRHGSPTSSCAS